MTRWNSGNGPVFRNPVRTTKHLPAVKHKVAVVRQRETRKTKTTAGAKAVRPSSQHFLQVMVDEGMFEHVTRAVGNERACRHGVFTGGVLGVRFFANLDHTLSFLCAEQLEQFREVVFLPRLPQLLDLPECVWLDLKFNGAFWRVLHQGVARLEFEIAGDVTDAGQHTSSERMGLTVSQNRPDRPHYSSLVLGFNRRFRQDDVGLKFLGDLICHDFEGTFRLRPVERQAELVKAVTSQNLRAYLRPCLFCESRPFFQVEIEILVLIRTLLPPFYEESLHFVSEEVAAVLCLQPAK